MEKKYERPEKFFLERYDLSSASFESALGRVLGKKIDYADLYFEYETSESLSLEEGIVKKVSKNISQGVGVRAISEEKTGYAYSDDISTEQLLTAAKTARYIAKEENTTDNVPIQKAASPRQDLYPVGRPPIDVPIEEKIDLLHRIDRLARGIDPRIKKVMASFSSEYKIMLVVTSNGLVVGDILPLMRLNVTCIAEKGENRQVGSFGGGGRREFGFFLGQGEGIGDSEDPPFEHYAREAARQALLNLDAVDAPAGPMEVVLGPGWPGILLHEAIGHGLEADFNRKKTSAFSGRLGERVASELCTVIDDGTIPGRRGSLNCDDEGTPTSRTVLIEKGILKNYLQDRLNASLMKMPLTGNGRRESYAHSPMPRMTNTFMLSGDSAPDEIIRSVKRGLYAVSFGGGQVDITSGKFVFSASEAYMIEDGKIGAPVKGATLIGNGPDVLTRVSMVGNDMALDSGIGTCGKDGQSVPVGVGLPTIKISEITVGGTRS
ncbi:MAG: metalloprotease TldD [Nitrospira sp.]|nr:metalloprotease TldD [Candidatus Manganitrophaceae bacterium]HIL34969.1 metalloprotease TldD [Candidatus Manganitrophaceae bacterium]